MQKTLSSRSFPNPSISISLLVYSSSSQSNPPFCFEKSSLLYLETRAHQWSRKVRVLRVPVLERGPRYAATKVAFLLSSRDPPNSSLQFCYYKGGLRSDEVLRRGEESLLRSEPIAFLLLSFCHFCFCYGFLSFSCPFDSNIAIFYRTI